MCDNKRAADVNEIYFSYLLNNNQFTDDHSKEIFYKRVNELSEDEVEESKAKAMRMYEYYKENYDINDIHQVWWTGENITTEKIIGMKIEDRECPADVIIRKKSDASFFGISLKTAKNTRNLHLADYGIKRMSTYVCVDDGIELTDYAINEGAVEVCPEIKGLTLNERNKAMKENKEIYDAINSYGSVVLTELRDIIYTRFTEDICDNEMCEFILDFLLIRSGYRKLKYIQLECVGTKEKGYSIYEDNIKDRLDQAEKKRYNFVKYGSSSIRVFADNKPLINLSVKFKSRKLSSAPVIKVQKICSNIPRKVSATA